MKKYIVTIICILMTGACLTTANARKQPVPHMYMFGLAASFTDTIVHFTAIQELDSVWIESKNDFLQERDSYSSQLREYLNQKQQMPHRTCIVFYSQKRAKLEKKFQKIMRLYTQSKDGLQHFDVRHICSRGSTIQRQGRRFQPRRHRSRTFASPQFTNRHRIHAHGKQRPLR